MMKLVWAVCALFLGLILCGCAHHTHQFQSADYVHFKPLFSGYDGYGYSSGFTGYTQGYDGYGDYDDGFGYSWWMPRFNFYTAGLGGYANDQGYYKYPYPQ